MTEKRFWELHWDKDKECTKCGLKFKSEKYIDCYNCREKQDIKRLFTMDMPAINHKLMIAICDKLEIDHNEIIRPYWKTVKEHAKINGIKDY